jgi:hypothetical protein
MGNRQRATRAWLAGKAPEPDFFSAWHRGGSERSVGRPAAAAAYKAAKADNAFQTFLQAAGAKGGS